MPTERRFRQGDGQVNILPDEVVLLDYTCRECGRAYEVMISASSRTAVINCNEERLCEPCEKRALVRILQGRGCTVPEEQLLQMTIDELLSVDPKA
jgi:hypothetical protein